jgi:hypothetical protein
MATANFNFTELSPNDQAGYVSINALIQSIDTLLNTSARLLPGSLATTSGYTLVWSAGALTTSQLGTTGLSDAAVTEAKIANNAVTAGKLASTLDLSTNTVTLPNGVTVDGAVVTPSTDDSTKVATTAFVQDAVQNATSGVGVINYSALAADAKTYDVPTSGTGVYFTASGDFTSDSLSTATAQNPIVNSAASSTITLSLPNNIGTEGATITVCQTGTGTVVISPKSGSAATINGSTSTTYALGAQYSVVTLLCLSNSGSNGTWVITGDYI